MRTGRASFNVINIHEVILRHSRFRVLSLSCVSNALFSIFIGLLYPISLVWENKNGRNKIAEAYVPVVPVGDLYVCFYVSLRADSR